MKDDTKFKSNFIWNIIGTGFNSFNSLFFLVLVTRINGINDAGIFTIAFSTACILYVIGTYAGRIFQVTDKKETTDKEYIVNRAITCITMIIITVVFVVIKNYEIYKSGMFIILSIYKAIEAFSDVLYGIMQKNDLLNNVGKSYFIKGVLSIVVFAIVDHVIKNMLIASILVVIVWVIIIFIYDFKIVEKLIDTKIKVNIKRTLMIFTNGFFIFIISFLGIYIQNAPKYAIDKFLTEDIQAIFGIIIMPATVMSLVGQFLLHPYLTKILRLYEENKYKELNRLILRIISGIVIFGIIAATLAYLFGIPVLNLIYGIQIENYKIHLVAIIIAATLYNVGIVYSTILTTIRHTIEQFIIYLIVALSSMALSNAFIKTEGISGAVLSYFLIMTTYAILYVIISNIILKKIRKRSNEVKEIPNGENKGISNNTSV